MLSLAAVAAPAGAAAAEGLLAIAPAVGWLVLAALLLLYRRSIKKVLYGFASLIDVTIPLRGLPDIHPLRGTSKWVKHQADNIDSLIGSGMLYCEHATVYLLNQAWHLILWQARELADLADAVERRVQAVALGDVPKVLRQAIAPVLSRLRGIDQLVGRLEDLAKAQARRLQHGIDRIEGIATKTAHTAVKGVTSRVGRLERTLSGLRGHAGAIERALGATAVATLVGAALGRLGLRWLRCGNVRKVGKAACGMDTNLLEALLGASLLVVGGLSLREMARDLQGPVEAVTKGLDKLVTEVRQ